MPFRKLTDFIQEDVIVAMLRDKLEAKVVTRSIVSGSTQDTLGVGSSYKIPGVGDLTVAQYDGTPVTPEDATQSNATILMDRYPLINFYLEYSDIKESTALSLADAWAEEAANRIAQDIDVDVLATVFAGATTSAGLGVTLTPIVVTSADAIDYVELYATTLAEANIDNDAVLVLPSYIGVALAKELGVTVNNERIAGQIELGYVSNLFGLDIYTSNNLPIGVAGGLAAGEYGVVGGKRSTFHLIEGLTIVEDGKSETKPASFNQYGQVYGRGFSNAAGWYAGVVAKA